MSAQLYQANGIIAGRAHRNNETVNQLTVERDRAEARRARVRRLLAR